jgi:hypothetical protein
MPLAAEAGPMYPVKTHLQEKYLKDDGDSPLATFLGLFSIGLGLAEAVAPRAMADRTGVRMPGLLRAYGLREIAAGVGILASRRPGPWLWARVAGDVLDLATLAAAYGQSTGADRRKAVEAAAAVAGVTALDVACAAAHT